MDYKSTNSVKIIDTIVALQAIMPALLHIIARQDPRQRKELEAALAEPLERFASRDPIAHTGGVADILNEWRTLIVGRPTTARA